MSQEITLEGCNKCDFCGRQIPIVHRYKCETYKSKIVPMIKSIDEWAACEDCERLVETSRWHELAKFCAQFIQTTEMRYMVKLSLILALHDEFKEHRI